MQKVMITGATGLLGRTLYKTLKHEFAVVGTGFSRATAPILPLDLADQQAVITFLELHKPTVLIHAAAERKPDVCENSPQQTIALNVAASEFLAKECAKRNIRLLFISTDYVFDGQDAPYYESATPNPLNLYGQTKQQAEQAVLNASPLHTIIRVPVLYGDVTSLNESAVTVIATQLKQDDQTSHDNWAIRYPTHVEDIAFTLRDLLIQPEALGGIFHISDSQAMTKFDMACVMADILGYPSELLTPQGKPTQTAARPYNCALADSRLKPLGIAYSRDFKAAVGDIINGATNK
ncbi:MULTISPECIES: dTDP-4-dehydrorhamnose reductase family protein [Pseudoalteromonas]|uniref:dTDP-4-dehydrorhamnose reductase n=1 Tax=Pseudoalteromonas amylolytica TaxID=1859457 RepID=A0A1S1MZM9_9GAMM|nr:MULTISPECIES: SDR family oxidoreductase [Pseudoalteromonas]OHU84595.1 NAD(P)-dependent oxidoreductase [Pseudoalteromonas sp. JW3]OHU92496.1 NAD(P)-dependent oxidoreductase [Pseudoalteromonas amylolytica]